jgi:hypothetical protein
MWDDDKPKNKLNQAVNPESDRQPRRIKVRFNFGSQPEPTQNRDMVSATASWFSLPVMLVVGFFFGLILLPSFASLFTPFFCPSDSILTQLSNTRQDGNTSTAVFHCLDSAGNLVNDASAQFTGLMFSILCGSIIFGFGIWMLRVGAAIRTFTGFVADLRQGSLPENMVKTKTSRKNFELDAPEPAENVMLNETTWQLRERAKRGEVTDAELAKIASFVQTLPESESTVVEVSERLTRLKEAYTAGLLTDDQYSRKRTEILNDL